MRSPRRGPSFVPMKTSDQMWRHGAALDESTFSDALSVPSATRTHQADEVTRHTFLRARRRTMLRVKLPIALLVAAAVWPSGAYALPDQPAPVASPAVTDAQVRAPRDLRSPDARDAARGGRVLRIDPKTGVITTFASGLPVATPGLPFGGAEDVAFFGGTAYVLVTAVGPFFGQANVVDGLYRIAKNG